MRMGHWLVSGAVIACAGLCAPVEVWAQSYPTQSIRMVVPAGPGSPAELAGRLASQILPPRLGQPIVLDHRPGAGGAIGMREAAKAPPDGYTLLSAGGAQLSVLPAISSRVGVDPAKEFAPVAKFMDSFQILVVHPSSPWISVKDLVAYAKANPGKLNYAHVGPGHITHLAGELFMQSTGTSLVGVAYRGGQESVTAVLTQSVQLTFENVAVLLPLIRDGKLRALAVTTATRTSLAPDISTMIEAGVPGYEVTTFFGVVAPAGTPRAIIGTLNKAINDGLRTTEMQDTIMRMGAVPVAASPEDFGAAIAGDLNKWQAVAKAANIKID
jgi:tripartite-type tricarboxylate transporter receptor subunit TctC